MAKSGTSCAILRSNMAALRLEVSFLIERKGSESDSKRVDDDER